MKDTTYIIDGQQIVFTAPSIKKHFYLPEDAQTAEEWHEYTAHSFVRSFLGE